MDLAPWTAPADHRVDRYRRRLSLQRPRPLPSVAPRGQDARDLLSFDTLVDHPGYACTPASILSVFRQAEQGDPSRQCDLFDDLIENDGHLRSLFEKRNQAVSGKPWVIQAGGQGTEAELAAFVLREHLRKLPMVEVFEHLLTYNRNGYACVEIDWDLRVIDGREWILPVWFTAVPSRRFRIVSTALEGGGVDELRLLTTYQRPLGDALRAGKWLVVRREGAKIARTGLMRTCSWPAMGKRYGFRDWMIYAQRFGLPKPYATYDETADDEAKNVAAEVVRSIGDDNGAIFPKSIELDFAQIEHPDNSGVHGGLIEHCNSEMSKTVNGSTLSNDNSDSGGASYALGEVHDSVRWEAVQYDAARIETAFDTQVAAAFAAFNAIAAPAPRLKIQVVRDLDPKTRVEVAATYKNELGGRVSAAQMGQELGFREPTDAADDLPGMPQPEPGAIGAAP